MWVVVTLDFIETVKKAVGDGRRLRFGWSHGLGETVVIMVVDKVKMKRCNRLQHTKNA